METAPFSDPDPGDTHLCTDWQITLASTSEVVWTAPCSSILVHIHLGDGAFVNSYAGRTTLFFATNYVLRVRHRDSSGDPSTEWSGWALRSFRTADDPGPGTSVAWTVRQSGFQIESVATGLTLALNIAFVPNPGNLPTSPYFYVTELYGNIRVVTRDGTVSDYIRGALNYRPSGVFPGTGEQGLTGIVVDPVSGDVFVSMLYESTPGGAKYPKVVRFHSNHGGTVAGSSQTILDMPGETMQQSHQISRLSIGPDGKLYVHMGDGFDTTTAQNLSSFRGKILRVNLDGTPATDNPFYNASDGISARDYVWAYGFRNPFGADWRASDGAYYEAENGPSVDRFAKIVGGRNYLWDGTDTSMHNYAIYNWSPAVAPVNVAFVQSQTFGGSAFPLGKVGHAFVSESGPTYAAGPVSNGKRISELTLDASGNLTAGPTPLIEYTGTGRATVAGLAAGPDGLYFTDLYKDSGSDPTAAGSNVMRVRWVGGGGDFAVTASPTSRKVRRGQQGTYTITVTPSGGFTGGVTLSTSSLPSGVTGAFGPNPVNVTSAAAASSTFTLTASAGAKLGKASFTVIATGQGLSHTVKVSVQIAK
jgi:glucose/arabinose dehydrogenase